MIALASIARQLLGFRLCPIPLPYRSKTPTLTGWQNLRIAEATVDNYFGAELANIGCVWGEASQHTVAIDLDWPEASIVGMDLLPATTPAFGRSGTLRQMLVRCADARSQDWVFRNSKILQLLAAGKQSVMPGSVHHDTGQPIEWLPGRALGEQGILEVAGDQLLRWCDTVAAAALLVRVWNNATGTRHDLAQHLSGALLHSDWTPDQLRLFFASVLAHAQDNEKKDRARAIEDTIDRHQTGETFTGLPRLAEVLDSEVMLALVRWLHLDDPVALKINGTLLNVGGTTEALLRESSVVTLRLSEVDPEPISWLWPGVIALGKLTIVAGDPGLGKSQLGCNLAAIATSGGSWPGTVDKCIQGNVVLLSAEDDTADTLVPRAIAAGADRSRIYTIEAIQDYGALGQPEARAFDLKRDLPALERFVVEIGGVQLVIVDPITAFLGQTDSHKTAEVRALLAPLSKLAAKLSTAVVAVTHLNKAMNTTQAMMRVTGSLAFVAAARAAFLVTHDAENQALRLFLPIKNNIGPDQQGFAFTVQEHWIERRQGGPICTSRIVWELEQIRKTADQALREQSEADEDPSALDEAQEFLQQRLAAGPAEAKVVIADAKQAGISSRTLKRAKAELRVVAEKSTGEVHGAWNWRLP